MVLDDATGDEAGVTVFRRRAAKVVIGLAAQLVLDDATGDDSLTTDTVHMCTFGQS